MKTTKLELEFGGIEADRAMQAGVSHVPQHMELTEDAVLWAGPFKEVRPGPGLLENFLNLVDESDEEIFRYARRWGVLGICKHGVPASHNDYPFGVQHGVEGCWPLPAGDARTSGAIRDSISIEVTPSLP